MPSKLGWVTHYTIDGTHSPEEVTGRLDEEEVAPSCSASRISQRINARRSFERIGVASVGGGVSISCDEEAGGSSEDIAVVVENEPSKLSCRGSRRLPKACHVL